MVRVIGTVKSPFTSRLVENPFIARSYCNIAHKCVYLGTENCVRVKLACCGDDGVCFVEVGAAVG